MIHYIDGEVVTDQEIYGDDYLSPLLESAAFRKMDRDLTIEKEIKAIREKIKEKLTPTPCPHPFHIVSQNKGECICRACGEVLREGV